MGKEFYDEAYQTESNKFPAIIRLTNVNKIILLVLVILYVAGSFGLAFLLGDGEEVDTFFLILAVAIDVGILGFAYWCLAGSAPGWLRVLMMIIIPIWAGAVLTVPEINSIANCLFILPLLWLEIMMIVEHIIHKKAQRRSIDLEVLEREHYNRTNRGGF